MLGFCCLVCVGVGLLGLRRGWGAEVLAYAARSWPKAKMGGGSGASFAPLKSLAAQDEIGGGAGALPSFALLGLHLLALAGGGGIGRNVEALVAARQCWRMVETLATAL